MPAPSVQLPRQLFFATPEDRLSLARERFFERGEKPLGLVDEAVLQSWGRCLASGLRTQQQPLAQRVGPVRLHAAMRLTRLLREAAAPELQRLEATIAFTASRVILTSPDGVVVHVTQRPQGAEETVLPALGRVGIDLSEDAVGTTAPGIVARTGRGVSVRGAEHFSEHVVRTHCAAAPIHDVHGQLAGVLDLTIEGRGFGFDAYALVASHACAIENRLLQLQSPELLVLSFQADPALLGTPLEALVGIDGEGRLRWANAMALRLGQAAIGQSAEEVFGRSAQSLLSSIRQPAPQPLTLPNGLTLWSRAQLRRSDGAGPLTSVPPPAALAAVVDIASPAAAQAQPPEQAATPATLKAQRRRQIQRTLDDCGGNVARAARLLGVSRGLIYRTLREVEHGPTDPNGNTLARG
ncbi:GAF domain-containing protein [uncultured Aquincola sp.]|uniref:GAF domain-containing protein n=1 Tax=uncultured Aquincola sp. TaxID=886556 RepID=UPI0032B1F50E